MLNDQPIAYYPLYLTNTTEVDASGNGNDGVYVNIFPGFNNVPGPSPYITNAVSFDGASTYVDLGSGSNPSLLNFGGRITLEAWVQAASTSVNGYILGKGYDSTTNASEIVLRCPGDGVYEGGTHNTTTDAHARGGTVTTNWVHLVCASDGTNWNLYLNGGLVATTPDTVGALNFPTPWAIGDGTADGGSRIFTGNITQAALYTNGLSAQRVLAHYFSGIYGTTNPPPVILAQPAPQVASPGATVSFSVTVLSASPVTNQWFKNGAAMTGATNLTLTLTNVQTNSSGNYSVRVGNSAGTTNSASANLLVLTPGVYGISPLPITPGSYNYDSIVESSASISRATTASMDGGTANSGFSWYETGFNGQTDSGLPAAGSTVTNGLLSDHRFAMAPSYTTNDAVLLDASVPSATITLTTPTAFTRLAFFSSSGHGNVTNNYTVHHANGGTDTGSFVAPDWFGGTNVVLYVGGRVDVRTRQLELYPGQFLSNGPAIGVQDITLGAANLASPVTSIDLTASNPGGSHACVLAVSGAPAAVGNFNPITIAGYNYDMIVEAAAQSFAGGAYTTASMDNSTANTQYSWYENGFTENGFNPGGGVPVHGSTITNQAQPDHTYTLAPSYTASDVVLIDATHSASMTPISPAKVWRLSFLTAAGHGPVGVNYVLSHTDNTTESGTFSSPDWFTTSAVAWAVYGRVDVGNGGIQTFGNAPNLFSADIGVTNIVSAVTNIALSYAGSGGNAEILAVSAAYIDQSRAFTGVQRDPNGSVTLNFSGIPGYKYLTQRATNLVSPVLWQNLGTNTANTGGTWQFTDNTAANRPAGFYRALYLP